MGFLHWLFGPRVAAPVGRVDDMPARSGSEMGDRDVRGLHSSSPDGRYRLVWCEGDRITNEAGWYALLDEGRVVARGTAHRPNDGKVSNAGIFIINDWGWQDQLSGVFRAYRPDGTPIIARAFSANLFNNGLSDDGRLACCQTANAPSDDGGVLTTFDLFGGKEAGRFIVESGWAIRYEFPPDLEGLRLVYRDGVYAYTLTGDFLQRDRWVSDRLGRGDLLMVRRCLDEATSRPDAVLAGRLLTSISVGLVHRDWRDDRPQAFGWRLRGEIEEAIGALEAALASYDKALAFDPKIGIKRRADRLREVCLAPRQQE